MKAEILIEPGRIITNDGSHGAHTPENPDDGSTSQFALDLAKALEQFGIVSDVHRMED